ncbi:MAG TPA: hypothetical protein VI112_17280 [Bacteroidia bacterium]
MNRSHIFIFLSVVLLAASSCNKESGNRRKYSGVYKIEKYEISYYSNNKVDSVFTLDNPGTIGLYDNGLNPYNNERDDLPGVPRGWVDNAVGGVLPVGWYTDEAKRQTITFFSEDPGSGQTYYAIYTVDKKIAHRYTWTYVGANSNGDISYKEVFYLKKQ